MGNILRMRRRVGASAGFAGLFGLGGAVAGSGTVATNSAPVPAGQFSAALTAGQTSSFASRFTDPEAQALTYGARNLPAGWSVSTAGVLTAPGSVAADAAPSIVSLYADDGQDANEIVGINASDTVAGTALLACGQYLRDGDATSGQTLRLYVDGVEVPSQVTPGMLDYASGNRRFFRVRGLLSLAATGSKHVSVRPSASGYSGTTRTLAAFQAASPNVSVVLSNGVTGTFTLASALAVASPYYLEEGPVCCEVITASQAVTGTLRIEWHAIHLGSGNFGFRVRLASGSIANADKIKYTCDIDLRVNGSSVQTWTAADIWPDSSGWLFAASDGGHYGVGTYRQCKHLLDEEYLVAANLVPSIMWRDYASGEQDNAYSSASGTGAAYIRTWDPLGTFRASGTDEGSRVMDSSKVCGHGGHEDDIGVWQRWFLLALFMRNWANYVTTRINALADRYQIRESEPSSMLPADPGASGRQNLTWQNYGIQIPGGVFDARCQSHSSNGYYPATHASDDFGAYVLFGDPWYVRELQYQAYHNHYYCSEAASARDGVKGLMAGWLQSRGIGGGLRTLVRAWLVTPAASSLAAWMNASIQYNLDDLYGYIGQTPIHMPRLGEIAYASGLVNISITSTSWYCNHIGWLALQGLPLGTGYPAKLTAIADDAGEYLAGYAGTLGTSYPYQYADTYEPQSATNVATGWPNTSWAAVWTQTKSYRGYTDPASANLVNTSNGGFYAQYIAQALSYAMRRGHANATAAFLRLMQASNLISYAIDDGTAVSRRKQITFTGIPLQVTHGS